MNRRENGDRPWKLHLHFLTLTDFTPHPASKLQNGKLEAVTSQTNKRASLVIQVSVGRAERQMIEVC